MHKLSKKYLIVIAVFAVLGMLDSAYLTLKHYKPTTGTFCNLNDYINCDIVNQSTYAELFGIPIAILGFLTYLAIFVITTGLAYEKLPRPRENLIFATLISFFGLFFSLYLTYVELFILYAVCLLCVISQLILIFISIFIIMLWIKKEHAPLPPLPL
jgi:uncharacterized membrane protein